MLTPRVILLADLIDESYKDTHGSNKFVSRGRHHRNDDQGIEYERDLRRVLREMRRRNPDG